ncbi:MAG: M20/M25/M40 family metallo-hydrolase, partial [Chloroflexi bacterium]|nr:M20/M25/M40 family metallo-hydrolase [Chloroflexota bacterium]
MRNRLTPKLLLFLGSLLLAALACNLTAPPPPTLVPFRTPVPSPPPTLGFQEPGARPESFAPGIPQPPTLSGPALPGVTTGPSREVLNLINQVEANRLTAHVVAFQNMGTRHVFSAFGNTAQGIDAAYDYIMRHFNDISVQSNGRLTVLPSQEFVVSWGETEGVARNIIAVIQGQEAGGGIIVLGAHYDSISLDVFNANAPAPGANDNASGMAALLEIARIMSQTDHKATVMFVAFSAEEVGRQGSQAFVTDYLRGNGNNIDIDAMLNIDIIGSGNGPNGVIDDRTIRVFSAGPDASPSRRLARALALITSEQMP